MSDIKLKQLENKAVERLRRAYTSLQNDAVLPSRMTLPLGEVTIEGDVYVFELRVTLKPADGQ